MVLLLHMRRQRIRNIIVRHDVVGISCNIICDIYCTADSAAAAIDSNSMRFQNNARRQSDQLRYQQSNIRMHCAVPYYIMNILILTLTSSLKLNQHAIHYRIIPPIIAGS